MSVIDINGVLSFFDLAAKGGAPGTQGEHLAFERKVRSTFSRSGQACAKWSSFCTACPLLHPKCYTYFTNL